MGSSPAWGRDRSGRGQGRWLGEGPSLDLLPGRTVGPVPARPGERRRGRTARGRGGAGGWVARRGRVGSRRLGGGRAGVSEGRLVVLGVPASGPLSVRCAVSRALQQHRAGLFFFCLAVRGY